MDKNDFPEEKREWFRLCERFLYQRERSSDKTDCNFDLKGNIIEEKYILQKFRFSFPFCTFLLVKNHYIM